MNDKTEEHTSGTGISALIEGGVPSILLGPAGKALSRFLGQGVDTLGAAIWEYPKAYLDQKTQMIKDQTANQSNISQAVGQAVAALAAKDPQILERGITSWLEKTYRAQNNKEAIASKAYEQLSSIPPPDDAQEIDTDWLNVFTRFAEDVSSEKLQQTFAQILAGETRKPGSVSLATVQFLSILDQKTATAINEGFAWVVEGSGLLPKISENYDTFVGLRDAGLVATHVPDMQITITPKVVSNEWVYTLKVGAQYFWVTFPPDTKLKLSLIALSRTAQELFKVIPVGNSDDAVLEAFDKLKEADATSISRIHLIDTDTVVKGEVIWEKPPQP